ncbi:MAG: hypothetical protein IJ880_03400, partial [Bacilli bacterium]|nr:hypothetical protein [Bacilli bacterium]
HTTYYLIASVYVTASNNADNVITEAEITNMIGLEGCAPYVESLVTDPNVTVDTILTNLENHLIPIRVSTVMSLQNGWMRLRIHLELFHLMKSFR